MKSNTPEVTVIVPKIVLPINLQHLKVAIYFKSDNSKSEEYLAAIKTFEQNFPTKHPSWDLVGIFHDSYDAVMVKDCPNLQKLLRLCDDKEVDLIIFDSIEHFSLDSRENIKFRQDSLKKGLKLYDAKLKTIIGYNDDLIINTKVAVWLDEYENYNKEKVLQFIKPEKVQIPDYEDETA